MPASFVRLVSTASLACFVMQGCQYAPVRQGELLGLPGALVDTATTASQPVFAGGDAPTVLVGPSVLPSAAKALRAPEDRSARLQRALALETEAAQLSGDAEALRRQITFSLLPLPFSLGSLPNSAILAEIDEKLARAKQASSEAESLRRQVYEEVALGRARQATSEAEAESRRLIGDVVRELRGSSGVSINDIPRVGTSLDAGPGGGGSNDLPSGAVASSPATTPLTTAASFAAESGKIDSLVTGSAAVSAPATARAGDPFAVYLRVSPEKLKELLKGLKQDFPENETQKGKQGIKLTPRMNASVSGFGFEVSPKDGQLQAVSATEATTWQWQVKPVESGLLTLSFTLAGTLTIEGKEVPRNFYQYQQKVQVAVSPLGFMEQYWQWLATSLAIPAAGAFWAAIRKPKDVAGKRQPSVVEKLRERRRKRVGA